MSNEIIKPPATSDKGLNLRMDCFNNLKFWVELNGRFLKPGKVIFDPNIIMYMYIESWSYYFDNGFTLGSFLFGAVM